MHVRVKRDKCTWFVSAEPSHDVATLLQALAPLAERPAEEMQLTPLDAAGTKPAGAPLEPGKTLAAQRVADSAPHGLQFALPDGAGWEPLSVAPVPPLSGGEAA